MLLRFAEMLPYTRNRTLGLSCKQKSNTDEKTQHLAMYLNALFLMSGENLFRSSLLSADRFAPVGADAWPARVVAECTWVGVSEMLSTPCTCKQKTAHSSPSGESTRVS